MSINFTVCKNCLISQCLVKTLNAQEIALFEKFVTNHHHYRQGEHFWRNDQSLPILGVLKSGSARTELISNTGRRQIVGFFIPGELLVLNLLGNSESNLSISVIFLEISKLCLIPFNSFKCLTDNLAQKLQQELILRLSREVLRQQQLLMAVNNFSAEALVAMFLLDLSRRFHVNGFDKKHFHLSMSRSDIGIYLGLASETVSRIMTKFVKAGLININGKNINLKDFSRLEHLIVESKIKQRLLASDRRCIECLFTSERRESEHLSV